MWKKEWYLNLTRVISVSDRIMGIKIKTDSIETLVLQVYMPTTDHPDEEIDQLYDIIEEIIDEEDHEKINCLISSW